MWRRTIRIGKSGFFLFADPRYTNGLYGVNITPICRKNEVHFIIDDDDQYGDGKGVVFKGKEASTCLQVVRAYSSMLEGKKVSDVYFYALYSGCWRQISFKTFDSDLIEKQWPEGDTGKALGKPSVRALKDSDIINGLTDDFTADAFSYWYHTLASADPLIEEFYQACSEAARPVEVLIPFGDLRYDVLEHRETKLLFATDRSVLLRRIRKLSHKPGHLIFKTSICKGLGGRGYACVAIVKGKTTNYWQFLEPGDHILTRSDFTEITSKMVTAGGALTRVSSDKVKISLPVEVDFTKPEGGRVMMARRGEYFLTDSKTEDEIFF